MLIAKGHAFEVLGRDGANFRTNPRLRLTARNDWRPREKEEWVRGIVVHTRWGVAPVKVKPGAGPNYGWDLALAERMGADARTASCHVAIDADGSYGCFADLAEVATQHAGHVNGISVGIEMYQDRDGTVYQATLDACADILDVVTRLFGVQRQYVIERNHIRRFANIVKGHDPLAYLPGGNRGRDWCGIYGHRNVTANRGAGDPGDQIFEVLKARGYEGYNADRGEDLEVWEERQKQLGIRLGECDGVPGRVTRNLIMMQRHGGPGIWVTRPGDESFDPVHPAE